jgi:phosphate transport system substrate-binding protein
MQKRLFTLLPVVLLASLALAACGPAATPTPTEAPPPTEAPEPTEAPTADAMAMYAPDAVSGEIVAAGSSTVYPLSERMKQLFEDDGFTGQLTIDSIGSGAGFERFCKTGETDISNASRKIKDEEAANCAALATPRTPIEFRVGTDALSVVVSKENDFATDVTKAELAALFSTAELWSDVRPEWPAEPILRFSPGTDSGTYDYFVEVIMAPANPNADGAPDIALGAEAIQNASNLQQSEDDNVLVQGVEGSPYSIGYFGYAYYQENEDRLTALSVEGIAPTAETAESNEYPLSRPLFMYSDAGILQAKPQVAAFIYYYLTHVNDEILSVGYFPASDEAFQASIDAWKAAVGLQ